MADATTQTIYTQNRLPAWVQPYYTNLAEQAQSAAAQPYQAYDGTRLAGFTPAEVAAQQATTAYATGPGPSQFATATTAMNQGLGQLSGMIPQFDMYGQQAMGYGNQTGDLMQGYTSRYNTLGSGAMNLGGASANTMRGLGGLYGNIYDQANNIGSMMSNGYQGIASRFGQDLYGQGQNIGLQGANAMRGYADQAMSGPSTMDVNWSQYMQPYESNVTDVAARKAMDMAKQQKSELGSAAASAGAFGGYRHGLQESAIDKNTAQQISDMRVSGLQSAFDRGLGMFNSDRDARYRGLDQAMGAQSMANQSLQYGQGAMSDALYGQMDALGRGEGSVYNSMNTQLGAAQGQLGAEQAAHEAEMGGYGFGADMLGAGMDATRSALDSRLAGLGAANNMLNSGLAGIGQLSGMAGQMANMGAQSQSMFQDRMNMLNQVGGQQRNMQQLGLDTGYQDFLNQRNYPMDQLSWFSNILNGVPTPTSSSTSYMSQQPGFFNTLIGTGLGGLGMYNAMNG